MPVPSGARATLGWTTPKIGRFSGAPVAHPSRGPRRQAWEGSRSDGIQRAAGIPEKITI